MIINKSDKWKGKKWLEDHSNDVVYRYAFECKIEQNCAHWINYTLEITWKELFHIIQQPRTVDIRYQTIQMGGVYGIYIN